MGKILSVLIVEDSEDDCLLLLHELRKGGYHPEYKRVDTEIAMVEAIEKGKWDIIISDYAMPQFNGLAALKISQRYKPDIPFIIVSGIIGEDVAVEAMKAGAHDYLMKGNLERFTPAIERELHAAEIRRDHRRAENELKESRKIEADLILAKESANVANLAKSKFLADMSHEIRTPLNAILGFSEILKTKINDPQLSHHIEVIHSNGKSLLTLIDDILDLSRIEAGRVKPDPKKVNMNELCQGIEQLFIWKILEKEIALTVDIEPALPKGLLLDKKRLSQVIINLVGNAVKFTDKGFIKLTVQQIPLNTKDCINLFISIADTGIGIPKDQYESIFEPFITQNGQDDYKYQSKGLGLSITKKLVSIMNGTISLESNLGVGSVFNVILNDVKIISEEKNHDFETEKYDFKNISFEKVSILVVDDLQDNLDLIKAFLIDTNIDIIEAGDGKEAIDFARKYYPKLILMDLRMPILDGYEAIRILQNDKGLKSIPVIALTAAAMKEDKEKALKFGFNGYLRKPVNKEELLSEIMRFLQHKKN